MIKDYKDNTDALINEIYERCITKNYLLEENYTDSIDYISAKLKSELGNYYTIQSKDIKSQRSITKCFVRKLNQYGNYQDFSQIINNISNSLKDFNLNSYRKFNPEYKTVDINEYYSTGNLRYVSRKDFYRVHNLILSNNLDLNKYFKPKDESQVKYFSKIVSNKDLIIAILQLPTCDLTDIDIDYMYRYYKYYLECVDIATNNIKSDKELIFNILNYSIDFDKLNLELYEKQLIKYINQRIIWKFGNLKRKLKYYRFHVKGINAKCINKENIVLFGWFGLEYKYYSDQDILEINCLNKNQKQFILDVRNICSDISLKFNKTGEVDLSKKEVAEKLGLSLTALDKKCLRIRNKIRNAYTNTNYVSIYKCVKSNKPFRKLDPKIALADMYLTEEQINYNKQMILEGKIEVDENYNYNYNYWTSFDAKRTNKENMVSYQNFSYNNTENFMIENDNEILDDNQYEIQSDDEEVEEININYEDLDEELYIESMDDIYETQIINNQNEYNDSYYENCDY